MPYKTTWKKNGVIWKFSGIVTASEIEQANSEFYADERSDFANFQLIDTRMVDEVIWEEIHIKETAAKDKGANFLITNLKVAYITKDSEIKNVLEKYIDVSRKLNSTWIFQGFNDEESALNWLKSSFL